MGEIQPDGIIERAVELVAGQARTLKAALEHRVPPDARILCWLVEFAAYLMNRCDIGSNGKTPLQRRNGRRDNTPMLEFGERILDMPAKSARGGKWEPSRDWRSRQGRRTSDPSRRDGKLTGYSKCGPLPGPQMAVTMRFDIQVGMERPAEMVLRDPGDADGKQNSEDLNSQGRLRAVGSQRRLC